MDPITQFVESLAQEVGLNTLPPEVAEAHKSQLMQNVIERIGVVTMGALSDNTAKQYLDLIDKSADQKTISDFLTKNIPNYEQALMSSLQDFRNSYVSGFKA